MRLKDKVALITGGARGVGRAFAEAYVREGATVVIGDIDLSAAERTAAEIGPACSAICMNVADVGSIQAGVDSVVDRTGKIDILINNAALFDLAPIVDITPASYERLFSVNVHGVLFTMQAVARHMIAVGKGGKMINMASQAGRRGEALVAVYCATKAAVISLTQSAGLKPHQVQDQRERHCLAVLTRDLDRYPRSFESGSGSNGLVLWYHERRRS